MVTSRVEEMMRETEVAKEPGTSKLGGLIEGGDASLGMTWASLRSAGYTYIYDTETHERSLTNNNMLPTQLKKKRADGSFVFTTRNPDLLPTRGTLRCYLHPENPNRGRYDELGLPTCKKSNLISPFQQRRHMEKRHKMEWQAIEMDRVEAEKQKAEEEKQGERRLNEALVKKLSVKGKK